MQKNSYDITNLLLITTFLIMLMAISISVIVFLFRKRQLTFQQKVLELEVSYEKNLLKTQLEIQEQTFQHISREIHDNINLSLTLAKLNLNTIDWDNKDKSVIKIDSSIELLSQSIAQLSDMSKSLDADIIDRHGLLSAVAEELQRIKKTGSFHVNCTITGSPVYMNSQAELVIFRIIQEAFNNIIKHANARSVSLLMHYNDSCLQIKIHDDGTGFDLKLTPQGHHSGLKNMEARIKLLGGEMDIKSIPGQGTSLNFIIPFKNYDTKQNINDQSSIG